MKLENIKVNGYKNLIDSEMHFDKITVIIGPNNSGKSNLLEIFGFLNDILNGNEQSKTLLFNAGFSLTNGVFSTKCNTLDKRIVSIEITFTDTICEDSYKYIYFIEIHLGCSVNDIRLKNKVERGLIATEYFKCKKIKSTGIPKTIFERKNCEITKLITNDKIQRIDNFESVISIISKIKDIKDNLEFDVLNGIEKLNDLCKTPVLCCSPSEISSSLFGNNAQNNNITVKDGRILSIGLKNEIIKIYNSEKKQYFLEILSDILDIRDIHYIDFSKEMNLNIQSSVDYDYIHISFVFANNIDSSLNELSDGTLIALNLITYLFSNNYSILAIEELENSIHPLLLQKLLNLIRVSFSDTQVILTTHSPVLVNMVQLQEVSVISNNENGIAKIERVSDKKDLVRKLSNPFSSFGDIFFATED